MRNRKPIVRKPAARKGQASKKKASKYRVYQRFALIIALLILLSPLYYGYVLKVFSSSWQWLCDIGGKENYHTYKNFSIYIPSKYPVHGIDVSYAQGKIDWQKVKAMHEDSVHISFAFIKATEGLLTVDPYFKRNWREAAKAGLLCGAYHYIHPNKNGLWQARFFLQNVNMEAGDLPAVADIETLDGTSPEVMRKELQLFLTYVEKKTGAKPIIYSHLSFYADYLAGYFDGYPIWVARYDQQELNIGQHFNWSFWQHSDHAKINGIYHTVDFNAFSGDSLALRQMLLK